MNRRSFFGRAAASAAGLAAAPWPGFAATQEKFDVRNLRITDLRTILVDAGNDENYVYAKIYTNQGITGLGEGTLSGKCLTVATAIGELKRYLVGKDPTEIERHGQHIFRGPRYRGGPVLMSALSAVEIALWDRALASTSTRRSRRSSRIRKSTSTRCGFPTGRSRTD